MHNPLATIMVPTYGQEAYLARAIASALAQDLEELEVIVADDASPDRTGEIVASFSDPRLKYHRNTSNLGRTANYRQALHSIARGKYVLNLDGDDWLVDSTYIRRAVEVMERHPTIVLTFARAWRYRQDEDIFFQYVGQNDGLKSINSGTDLFLRYPSKEVRIPHLTAVYRREAAVAMKFYSQDSIGSDTDSILRLILGKQVAFIDRPVAVWRIHGTNATANQSALDGIANLSCVDSPYAEAKRTALIDMKSLRVWRRDMYADLSLDYIGRAVSSRRLGGLTRYLLHLLTRRPLIAFHIFGRACAHALPHRWRQDRHLPTITLRPIEESTA